MSWTFNTQQIGEGLVGEFLEILHPILGEQLKGAPGVRVELHALAGHDRYRLVG